MPKDNFQNSADSLISPAQICFPIAPSDSEELLQVTKAIYVGEGGDVTLRTIDGPGDVTFANVPTGAILDVRVRAVRATGTTATNIVGLA
ncbi:spike base protein, RCAP_Rcc01079 family [Altererythrobacter sp. Z27]|uniref:spike base protein, RCAP_Rcc01079 family n=1 Tax=Altererythrobacter sp. Z27 TaxID=3461147 RepID=UPI0040439AAC